MGAPSNDQLSPSGSRSRSRTQSKSPAGRASSNLKYDRYGNRDGSHGRDSSRMFGVGFGCDITYKSKDKVLYKFSGKAGQADSASGGGRHAARRSGATGLGTFHTIEEARKGAAKPGAAGSPPHQRSKPREPEPSVYKETQITSTLHHTLNESG